MAYQAIGVMPKGAHHVLTGGNRGLKVHPERQSDLGPPRADVVRRMLKGQAPGHPVAEHLSDEPVAGQLQVAGHERTKVLLLGIWTRLRKAHPPDVRLIHLSHLDGPKHAVRQDLVF